MKVKFGWVVGVNVAAACLLMQGCKAVRPTHGNDVNNVKTVETAPAVVPADDIQVTTTPAPEATPAPTAQPAPAVAPVPTAPAPAVTPAPAPEAAPAYTLYTVKPGDMLSKISKRYNIRQKAILDLNPGLSPNKLYAGKKIKLPGNVAIGEPVAAEPVATAAAPAAAAPASADAASVKAPKASKAAKYTGATKEVVVKSGDSLGKIAQENGTNVRTLKELNGLKSDRVFVGQKLKVPAEKAAAKPFAKKSEAKAPAAKKAEAKPEAKDAPKAEAKAKDDAKKADAAAAAPAAPAAPAADKPAAETAADSTPAPAAAEAAASATPAPAAAPAPVETHVVKAGEDVVSIAISYGVSPSALMDANDLKSSEVKEGDVLKIPAKSAQ